MIKKDANAVCEDKVTSTPEETELSREDKYKRGLLILSMILFMIALAVFMGDMYRNYIENKNRGNFEVMHNPSFENVGTTLTTESEESTSKKETEIIIFYEEPNTIETFAETTEPQTEIVAETSKNEPTVIRDSSSDLMSILESAANEFVPNEFGEPIIIESE